MLPPGFHIPDAAPTGGADGTVEIDPAALEKLRSALRDAAELLESGTFRDLDLAENAFGARPSATELGHEHRTAHRIIADTIMGVTKDLWGYRDGVQKFETGMVTADEAASADLETQREGVEALAASSALNQGEYSYHSSQRTNLTGASDAAPMASGGAPDADPAGDDTGAQDGDA
jgi:hypothetical protein